MLDYGSLWGIATVLGPLLLLGAMVYAVMQYRRRSAAMKQHTEEVSRRLYKEAARDERRTGE